MSFRALIKFYGLFKQLLFLTKYGCGRTARSCLHVAKALLEVNSCKVLEKDLTSCLLSKIRSEVPIPHVSVAIVLCAFRASFGIRALCCGNSLLLMSVVCSAVDFSWLSEITRVYKKLTVLGIKCWVSVCFFKIYTCSECKQHLFFTLLNCRFMILCTLF